jgi:hypothetical protein
MSKTIKSLSIKNRVFTRKNEMDFGETSANRNRVLRKIALVRQQQEDYKRLLEEEAKYQLN